MDGRSHIKETTEMHGFKRKPRKQDVERSVKHFCQNAGCPNPDIKFDMDNMVEINGLLFCLNCKDIDVSSFLIV